MSINQAVATAALFTLTRGADSNLPIPLLGNYPTPIAGFAHGYVNSLLTDNAFPTLWKGVYNGIYKNQEVTPLAHNVTRKTTHAATSGLVQVGLLYETTANQPLQNFMVGAISSLINF